MTTRSASTTSRVTPNRVSKKLCLTLLVAGALALPSAAGADPCEVPDAGGTVVLPPAGCDYLSPSEVHLIIDGLPPNTTIELAPIHKDFICNGQNPVACTLAIPPGICEVPGGSLGGNGDCFDSTLELEVTGTGLLAGFNRFLQIPIATEVHTAPRNPGDPVQSFDTEMIDLKGDLFGDPDFNQLSIRAGSLQGLPSPGHTTLTQLPGGDWNVDSFFDITYQIDFVGSPGSVLDGLAGSTTATIRMQAGQGLPFGTPGLSTTGVAILGVLLLGTAAFALMRSRPTAA